MPGYDFSAVKEAKNFASIADGDAAAEDLDCPGAALGDFCIASLDLDVTDLVINASVTAADVVTVVVNNNTGGAVDLSSGNLRVAVFKKGA